MSRDEDVPPDAGDAIARRLARFADKLERNLGDAARVEREDGYGSSFDTAVRLVPARQDALGVSWIDFGQDDLQVETASGYGGRFELDRTDASVDFIEDVVRSIVAGRVTEVFAAERSRVTVWLQDGKAVRETGSVGAAGCLPLPFWTRWGRHVAYQPYR